jgi:hypothetical protein
MDILSFSFWQQIFLNFSQIKKTSEKPSGLVGAYFGQLLKRLPAPSAAPAASGLPPAGGPGFTALH